MDTTPDRLLALTDRYRRQFERGSITAEELVSALFTHLGADARDPAGLAPQVAALIPERAKPHLLAHIREVLRRDYSASARPYLVSPTAEELSRVSAAITARVKAWAESLRLAQPFAAPPHSV